MKRNDQQGSSPQPGRDPLGLGGLAMVEPPQDGWPAVRAALEAGPATQAGELQSRRAPRAVGVLLAAAACLALVIGLQQYTAEPITVNAPPASGFADAGGQPLADLIAMSQHLEQRLRLVRTATPGMSSESALYVAELEDLVARIDSQLAENPESVALWAQRVNLMLDLDSLFQHGFEQDYARMASL
jgi:hypothetical protein